MDLTKNLRSLGYQTDLMIARAESQLVDRGRYIVIRTPRNPHFHWGNFLLYKEPPKSGSAQEWLADYKTEFGPDPSFVALGWDTDKFETPYVCEFLDLGFQLEADTVLVADEIRKPISYCASLEVRPLAGDPEWNAALQSHLDHLCVGTNVEAQREFARFQFARFRRMHENGWGLWFGAFRGGRMIGNMGIFWDEHRARFQEVFTDPAFRRQGVARTMCFEAASEVVRRAGARRFVTVADEQGDAYSGYMDQGFRKTQPIFGLRLFPASPSFRL